MDLLLKSPYADLHDVEVPFANTDSKEAYQKNLKKFGNEWYCAYTPISYKFNRLGYRMKQLEDVDYDNYYAFFGCSYTTGSGLALEDTFVYKIAQRANVDYVNAAVGGSGPDFAYCNFIKLMNNAPKKPKLIFINWPSVYRTFYLDEHAWPQLMLPNSISDNHWTKTYKDFIVAKHQVFNQFELFRTSVNLICKLANIPLFEMSTYQDTDDTHFANRHPSVITDIPRFDFSTTELQLDTPKFLHVNYARDIQPFNNGICAHPGLFHQGAVVNRFFEEMK